MLQFRSAEMKNKNSRGFILLFILFFQHISLSARQNRSYDSGKNNREKNHIVNSEPKIVFSH